METEWLALIEQSCRLFGTFAPSIHEWIFVTQADHSDDCEFVISEQRMTTELEIVNSGQQRSQVDGSPGEEEKTHSGGSNCVTLDFNLTACLSCCGADRNNPPYLPLSLARASISSKKTMEGATARAFRNTCSNNRREENRPNL